MKTEAEDRREESGKRSQRVTPAAWTGHLEEGAAGSLPADHPLLNEQHRLSRVLADMIIERARQIDLKRVRGFTHDCADPDVSLDRKYRTLGEEFGEVGQAIDEVDRTVMFDLGTVAHLNALADLRVELVQLATVAATIAMSIDRQVEESEGA